jgi:hypothetical protein
MLNEDQYMDRTPDLVSKIRKLREAAEKEMNRFTHVDDYDVRRVVGQKPKVAPAPSEPVSPSPANERLKKSPGKSASAQTSIDFGTTPAGRGDDSGNA